MNRHHLVALHGLVTYQSYRVTLTSPDSTHVATISGRARQVPKTTFVFGQAVPTVYVILTTSSCLSNALSKELLLKL